ncbi:MAG: type II 3-dehydroquinate dehydratase [Deltaproteobacteria bacterium]|nr:type II 3-dehydroquinate dehydratase [Deltaproteobacteria bacterium]
MKVLVINGPNLNMLGKREVGIYGESTLADIEAMVGEKASALGIYVLFYQSNHEGEIIERIQSAGTEGIDAMIINPGGYTHSSVAIRDAILAVGIPFVEVHITNVATRESFRKNSMFSDIALGTISGLGPMGYVLALEALADRYGR